MTDHCKGASKGAAKSANHLVTLGGTRAAKPAPEQREPPGPHAHWSSVDERRHGHTPRGEFPGGLPTAAQLVKAELDDAANEADGTTRRDFLTAMGFGVTAATVAACRAPEQRAIPSPVATPEMVPGVANYYATTCGACATGCSLLVKQRDGRPIKIEGNDASPLFGGATCASGQASVLSLYDSERLRGPLWKAKPSSWHEIDERVVAALREPGAQAAQTVLLSSTIHSPSLRALIDRWQREVPGFRHVTYDPMSASALRTASAQVFGRAVIPHYAFDRARVIVGLDADFLGTWISPVEFTRQYTKGRAPDQPPSLHVQFEPGMSVTGSNADQRFAVAPSALGKVAVALLARVAKLAGESGAESLAGGDPDGVPASVLDAVAGELWKHRRASLVVSGANDVAIQLVVLTLNRLLGNVGSTLDIDRPSQQRLGDDNAMAELVSGMQRGAVRTLIIHGVNPAYDYSNAPGFVAGLAKVALSISTAERADETAQHVHAVCPDHHFLESWGDAEPVVGYLSLSQPLIAPMFKTRSLVESLLRWLHDSTDHYTFLRNYWREVLVPRQQQFADATALWDHALERGVFDFGAASAPDAVAAAAPAPGGDWRAAAATIRGEPAASDANYEIALFESVALRDGRDANNPWLQELPDPITKVTWDNVAAIAPVLATRLGLEDGDVIALKTAAGTLELPACIQPGQHPRTISVAVGYGREHAGKAGDKVGVNAFPLATAVRDARRTWIAGATLTKTGRRVKLADTQRHTSMEGRPIVLEITRAELDHHGEHHELPNLWNERRHADRSWGMTIDLDACTGCSACVIACQAENNVPVVGKDQIQRERSMHWIRIDRYYSGSEDNPQALHQPMMCQHCGHAPCETVCPVLATTTSSEGLNQQTYNRCIGTRYCANNCPYKVRRFNWYNYTQNPKFDFNMNNPIGRLVLNPDVTVRSRGVMEKCSLCVQRIHAAKNAAVVRGEPMRDGEIETACQQVCPADAIVFGDLNDPKSAVATRVASARNYQVLEELGTRPNVSYLKKVRHGQTT